MNFMLKPEVITSGTSYRGDLVGISTTKMQQVFGKPIRSGEDSDKGYSGKEWRFISDDGQVVTVYERWQKLHIGAHSDDLFEPFVTWISSFIRRA